MLEWLLRTDKETSLLIMRLALGLVMFPHGAQKLLGWFGGQGFSATMHSFTEVQHIPAVFAFLAIAAESLGALGLVLGLLTRVAAFGIGFEMLVAALLVHVNYGFFMNWFGTQGGEGFEYHILAIGLALALVLKGGGRLSLDRQIYVKSVGGVGN